MRYSGWIPSSNELARGRELLFKKLLGACGRHRVPDADIKTETGGTFLDFRSGALFT